MEQPIAHFADDGLSWRCDGCGAYGSVSRASNGQRFAAREIATHIEECTPAQSSDRLGYAVIRPGDTVLIGTQRSLSKAEADRLATDLGDRMPGVKVLVLEGVTAISSYRP